MKFCPNCNTAVEDNATFCTVCGTSFNIAPAGGAYAQPIVNEYDHTAEFDANDVAENKIYAMLGYLFGFIGVAIAFLAKKESAYVEFHAKQALKISVLSGIVSILTAVLCWTFIVPFAGLIAIAVLEVVSYISFFDVCKGNAKEPVIVRSFKFLK